MYLFQSICMEGTIRLLKNRTHYPFNLENDELNYVLCSLCVGRIIHIYIYLVCLLLLFLRAKIEKKFIVCGQWLF